MNERIKVLIADDESMERKAVIEILRACRGGGIAAVEAVNGQDAVEKAASLRPDIVIMDLQMPVMDGFTSLREIYRVLPEVFAVILTAYDEFDYAVRALKLGVEDYILKPVRKQKLMACIETFERKRQQRAREREDRLPPGQALESLFPYMEDNLISSIVMDETINGHVRQLIHYLFPEGDTFALAVGKELQAGEATAAAHSALSALGVQVAAAAMGGQLILLLQCPPQESFAAWWDRVCASLAGLCGGWAVDGPLRDVGRLGEVYRSLSYGIDPEPGQSLPFSAVSPEKDIAVKLATLDEQGALTLFEGLFDAYQWGRTQPEALQQHLLSACIVVDHYLSKMTGDTALGEIPDFRRITGQQELFQAVKLFVASRSNACQVRQQPRINKLIRDAIDDLERNYQDGLYSLNAAAGHLDLTPAYLSKVFKTRMGKTFTEYLSEVRIDEAKKLLRDTEVDIAHIARHCGFNSANYFCKVFKKFAGISASDYREGRG